MKKLIAIFGVLAFTAGMAFGQGNIADVYQKNDGHEATVEQTGSINEAIIEQVAYNDVVEVTQNGTNNKAEVWQGNENYHTGTSWNSRAYIDQVGSDNTADVTQRLWTSSQRNIATINQDGTNNHAEQDLTNGARALIDQKGEDNQAFQFLNTNYRINRGTIYQEGDGNWAKQTQGSTDLVAITHQFGNDNIAETDQTGTGNTAKISQGWEIDEWEDVDYQGELESDLNNAKITQHDSYNYGVIGQFGDSNNAEIMQSANDNHAIIMQLGNSNTANVTQSAY